MTHAVATRNSDTVFFSSTDDYIRKNNKAGMQSSLGIGSGAVYIDVATGNYGTVKVDDDRGVTWAGYAVRDDWVLMSNGAAECGIYNDTDNEWMTRWFRNAQTEVCYNGSTKLSTTNTGISVAGAVTATGAGSFGGTVSISGSSNLDMLGATPASDARYLYLPRGGGITLYGSSAINHGIFSRNLDGVVSDDVRINSYGGVSIILDTNSNNSSGADFHIGKHSTGTANLGFVVSGETYDVTTEGNVTAYGTVSDIRYKEDIEKIDSPVERLQKINGVTFKYKEKDGRLMGVIAQELLEDDILKLAVYENETVQTKEKRYAVRYEHLTAMLIEAVKEQQKQIDELKEIISGATS
jgi:DNA-directed RNA polymerase subunit L